MIILTRSPPEKGRDSGYQLYFKKLGSDQVFGAADRQLSGGDWNVID